MVSGLTISSNSSIEKLQTVHHCQGLINAHPQQDISNTLVCTLSRFSYLNAKVHPSSMVFVSPKLSIGKFQTVSHFQGLRRPRLLQYMVALLRYSRSTQSPSNALSRSLNHGNSTFSFSNPVPIILTFFFSSLSGGNFPLLSRLKDESAARFPLRYRCAADKPFKFFNDTRILLSPVLTNLVPRPLVSCFTKNIHSVYLI